MQTEKIEREINWWKGGVAVAAAALIAAYFWYFGFKLEQPAAENSEKWGQFGDFIGGLMNPLVAFAAFYWLTQSVKLQKKELAETRKALEDSATSQKEMALASKESLRLQAVSAYLNAVQSELATSRSIKSEYDRGVPSDPGKSSMYSFQNGTLMKKLDEQIKTHEENRDFFQSQLVDILSSYEPYLAKSPPKTGS